MKRGVLVLIVMACLSVSCTATDVQIDSAQMESIGIEKVYEAMPENAREFHNIEDISPKEGMRIILQKFNDGVSEFFTSGFKCVMIIVAISVLCEIIGTMSVPQNSVSVKNVVSLAGALTVTAIASGSIKTVIGMAVTFIRELDVFSKALLPTLAAAEAACGLPGAAVAKSTATVFFSDVLITLINRFLIPLVYVNVFASTAYAAAKNDILKRICDLSTKSVSFILRTALGIFLAYIAVVAPVMNGADSATVKTAQFAVQGVPVVGRMISEATKTVFAGAVLMKNAIGMFGMLVVLSSCVTPFVAIGMNYILFKFATVCSSPVIGGNIAELTERIGQSFGLVFAMVATCAAVTFIAILSAMKSIGVI